MKFTFILIYNYHFLAMFLFLVKQSTTTITLNGFAIGDIGMRAAVVSAADATTRTLQPATNAALVLDVTSCCPWRLLWTRMP